MTPSTPPLNPFVAAGMLTDTRLFVGRKDELRTIISKMSAAQPTSVNVVGERRIGKSSLLHHFFQTWEQLVANPSNYVVIYLSLQDVSSQEDFYLAVAQKLLNRPVVKTQAVLTNALQVRPLNRQTFSLAIAEFKKQRLLPVLCLDDFRTLFKYPQEFNDGFYDKLRSLMDQNQLMLVIASRKELSFYSRRDKLTSSFFNLGHTLRLGEFTKDEVKDLFDLSANTIAGAQVSLSVDEQHLMQKLGGNHPFLLQLAGSLVWEARQQKKDKNWIEKSFATESRRRLPRPKMGSRRWWGRLRWLFWDLPIRLGRLPKFIGGSLDDLSNWVLGMVILIVPILAVFGLVTQSNLWEWLLKLVNKVLG
ncbi:MAG: AAA-like domain-containing protein [Cyanobacteria bacterium J06639_18]